MVNILAEHICTNTNAPFNDHFPGEAGLASC